MEEDTGTTKILSETMIADRCIDDCFGVDHIK